MNSNEKWERLAKPILAARPSHHRYNSSVVVDSWALNTCVDHPAASPESSGFDEPHDGVSA